MCPVSSGESLWWFPGGLMIYISQCLIPENHTLVLQWASVFLQQSIWDNTGGCWWRNRAVMPGNLPLYPPHLSSCSLFSFHLVTSVISHMLEALERRRIKESKKDCKNKVVVLKHSGPISQSCTCSNNLARINCCQHHCAVSQIALSAFPRSITKNRQRQWWMMLSPAWLPLCKEPASRV